MAACEKTTSPVDQSKHDADACIIDLAGGTMTVTCATKGTTWIPKACAPSANQCCYEGEAATKTEAVVVDLTKKQLKTPEADTPCDLMLKALKKGEDGEDEGKKICMSDDTEECTGYCEYVIAENKINGTCKPGACQDATVKKCCLDPKIKSPLKKSKTEFEDKAACIKLLGALEGNGTGDGTGTGPRTSQNPGQGTGTGKGKNDGSNVVHLSISVFSIISLIWLIFPF